MGQGNVLAPGKRPGADSVQLGAGFSGFRVFDPGRGEIPGGAPVKHAAVQVGQELGGVLVIPTPGA